MTHAQEASSISTIEITRAGGTSILTMNRPAQRNAMDYAMREELATAIAGVRDDPGVTAVILTGAGGNFCAGADVKILADNQSATRDIFEGRERVRKIHRWFDELVDLEKPVIAAVDGLAFGGGLSLALAADFILASPRAKFCCVFARIGYVPDMGSMYLLPRAVGLANAKDLVFTGRVVDVGEAKAMGLVHTICEDVQAAALDFAARFATAPAGALGIAKAAMNRTFETDRQTAYAQEAMAQAMCRESDFHAEAVRRFMAKEPALYEWPKEAPE